MDNHQIIEEGRRVFNTEIAALQKTRDTLNETFATIIQEFSKCKGKIIVTGMGKPGHIATKIAASLSSLGTPSFCLHPAEAMHGDLGMVTSQDVVFAISYSGESDEIVRILPYFKLIGAKVIALTGNPDSTLAKAADISEVSSTTAELCYGDALAVVCSIMAGFRDENYARIHPAGSLGKKLIYKVSDIMVAGEDNAVVQEGTSMKDTIIEISKKGLGMVSVVDAAQHLRGIVTNGDLRRQLDEGVDIYALRVEDVMTKRPIVINSEQLAVEALNLMKERMINSLPVIDRQDRLIGTIRWQDILHAGIVTM